MKKKDTEREVLEALFSVPDRIHDHQKSTHPVRTRRQSPYGRIVAKPLEENLIEDFTFITRQPINERSKRMIMPLYSTALSFLSSYQLSVFIHPITLLMLTEAGKLSLIF